MILHENGYKLLLVEDDLSFSSFLQGELKSFNIQSTAVYSGKEAVRKAKSDDFDIIILDLGLPDVENRDLLKVFRTLREIQPHSPIIIITGEGKVAEAVAAIKLGAYDFLEKPVSLDRLEIPIRNALDMISLRREKSVFHAKLAEQVRLIGHSSAIKSLLKDIARCAPTNSPVLILGETGVGKELVARAVYLASKRNDQEFVKVNCAAIPSELVESELFGHKKGSFTGALGDKAGKFKIANGGTLFLDEIGDLDLNAQVKILRALEEGEIDVVGGTKPEKVDVRFLSATNQNLEHMVEKKRFRQDLYYRLNTITLEIPPLRNRKEDIPSLATAFLEKYVHDNGLATMEFATDALDYLCQQQWPGNVRELKSMVERLVIFTDDSIIHSSDVAVIMEEALEEQEFIVNPTMKEATRSFQAKYITSVLKKHHWRIEEAASELGIHRSHLFRKMQDLNIDK